MEALFPLRQKRTKENVHGSLSNGWKTSEEQPVITEAGRCHVDSL